MSLLFRHRWGVVALAVGAGVLTALSLAPVDLVPLTFGHAVLLVLVARAESVRSAALRAWLWALG
ncbi:MAG: apolipoprotein N-acyltransferase, partial [bacterium]|nr:apolipoprotein N-acyltransferase [bacterium]